jgi:hypothetical protein
MREDKSEHCETIAQPRHEVKEGGDKAAFFILVTEVR